MQILSVSKGLPRQAEVAQRVPGRLRPQIFLMFRHYKGGRSSAKHTSRLYPRRNPWYSLPEAQSTSGNMVLLGVPRNKSPLTPPGIDPGTIRLVTQHLNRYATPGPRYIMMWTDFGGSQCPDDQDRDDPWNVGLLTTQAPEAAASLRIRVFH